MVPDEGGLAHLEQSEPAVSGHGSQGPRLQLPWRLSHGLHPQLKSPGLYCVSMSHSPARPFPSSIFRDKNRRDIGKSQSPRTDSMSHSQRGPRPPLGMGSRAQVEPRGEVPVVIANDARAQRGTGIRWQLPGWHCRRWCQSATARAQRVFNHLCR
jgi:hypothetical protein